MDDVRQTPPNDVPDSDAERQAQLRRLEEMLNEGLDDIEAGRVVSGEEVYRELKAKIAAFKKSNPSAQ